MKKDSTNREKGHITTVALFFVILILILTAALLTQISDSTRATAIFNQKDEQIYDLETSLNEVIRWMQANSANFAWYFSNANYPTTFATIVAHIASNDSASVPIVTTIEESGDPSDEAVMLSNDAFFGTSNFPVSGGGFDPVAQFPLQNFGADARVILIGSKVDSAPNNDPIFRIQVKNTNSTRGLEALVEGDISTGPLDLDFNIIEIRDLH